MEGTTNRKLSAAERMPDQLWLEVTKYVDYPDAIFLSQVSRLLHQVVNPEQWPVATRREYATRIEALHKHNGYLLYYEWPTYTWETDDMGLACKSCFKVKPIEAFDSKQYVGMTLNPETLGAYFMKKSGGGECIDCSLKLGSFTHGQLIETNTKLSVSFADEGVIPYREWTVKPVEGPFGWYCKYCDGVFGAVMWEREHSQCEKMHEFRKNREFKEKRVFKKKRELKRKLAMR